MQREFTPLVLRYKCAELTLWARFSCSPSLDSTAVISEAVLEAVSKLEMEPNTETRYGLMEATDLELLRMLSKVSSDTEKNLGNACK